MAAAANPKFKVQIFDSPNDLATFINQDNSVVATVFAIVCDNSGKYVLFYVHT